MAKSKYTVELSAKDKTKAAFSSMNKNLHSAEKSFLSINKAAAGLAGGLAVTAMVRFGKSALDSADKIQKLSTRLGASTEALSQYQHVAKLSGVSFETLTMGWQRMTRRVAEAAQGTGEAKDALKELGLSAQELAALKPEKQFEVIAEALSGVETQSDKVRLAMKLFDSEGVSLLQTMEMGAAGLNQMTAEADSLGLTLTESAARGAVDANDAIVRMGAGVDALSITFVQELGPAIADAVEWLNEAIPDAVDHARSAMDALIIGMASVGRAISWATGDDQEMRVWQGIYDNAMDAIVERNTKVIEVTSRASEANATFAETYEKVTAGIQKKTLAEIKAESSSKKSNKSTKDAVDELTKYQLSLIAAEKSAGMFADKLLILDELFIQDKISAQVYGEELEKLVGKTADVADATVVAADEMTEIWDNMTENMQRAFGDLIYDNMRSMLDDGKLTFKDFTDTIVDLFLRMLADMAAAWATQGIAKLFGLGGGGGFDIGSIFSGGGSGGIGGMIPGGGIGGALKGIGGKLAGALGLGGGGSAIAGLGTGSYAMTSAASLGVAGAGGGGLLGPTIGGSAGGGGFASLAGIGEKISSGFKAATSSVGGLGAALGYAGAAGIALQVAIGFMTDSQLQQTINATNQEFSALREHMALTGESAQVLNENVTLFGETATGAFVGINEQMTNMAEIGEDIGNKYGLLEQAVEGVGAKMLRFTAEGGQEMIKLTGNVAAAKDVIEQFGAKGASALQSIGAFTDYSNSRMQRLREAVASVGGEINITESSYDQFSGTVTASISQMIALQQQFGSSLLASVGAANSLGSAISGIPSAPSIAGGGVPGFATGGSFTVGGSGGTDSKFVGFMATPGERVTVETPQQQSRGSEVVVRLEGDLAGLENFIRVVADDHRVSVNRSGIRADERAVV